MNTKRDDRRRQKAIAIEQEAAGLSLSQPRVIPVQAGLAPSSSTPSISYVLKNTHQAALSHANEKVGVLIFGSATRPGGGWRNGATAQEEDISLNSTWGIQAENAPTGFYKEQKGLGADAILMTDGFWLRDEYDQALLSPLAVSFASIAAPNKRIPDITNLKENMLIDILALRLKTLLNQWHDDKCETVILGAIGCGVFLWEPYSSALAFKKAILASRYEGKISFAFIDPKIHEVFENVLFDLPAPLSKPKELKKP